ncbi:hypothetical protein E9993_18295 [Labilibacter sediminis]|nr:hypothetical protein E9993_18295 [Labilibacter sediminis]
MKRALRKASSHTRMTKLASSIWPLKANFRHMKNLIILLILLVTSLSINAQALTYGEHSLGIGIGVPAINNTHTSRSPAITATYEYGFSDKIGIGYIGGGALLSFSGAENEYTYINTKHTSNYSNVIMGPRAAYHFDMVELTGDNNWSNIDVYSGLFLGLNFQNHKYTNTEIKQNNTKLITDIFAGIRYGFNDKLGAFAEVGFGVTYLNLGVNVRL